MQRLLDLCSGPFVQVAPIERTALPWIAEFLARYVDVGARIADACEMYLAEHEGIGTVFTLDRRDSTIYRIGRNRSVRILPAPS